MAFADLFRRSNPHKDAAALLYGRVVEKARDPLFYTDLAVPDTVDGRFDMMVIHTMLVLRRLRGGGRPADKTGKALLELLFTDMDQSLREMGVGDMGVGRHIKRMAKAMFGRAEAYEVGLDGGDAVILAQALKDNLYRQSTPAEDVVKRMADYLRRAAGDVQNESVADILVGRLNLVAPVLAKDPQ